MKSLTALFAYLSFATFWETIDKMFFTPEFATYEHMTFFNSPNAFKLLVLGLYFGLVIASVCMYYNKKILGDFIRRLDEKACLSEESAKTLDELSYSKNFLIKFSLKYSQLLHKNVAISDENEAKNANNSTRVGGYRKNKLNFDSARFYIPMQKRDTTVSRFDAKGSGIASVILTAIIGILVVVAVFKLAPFVVGLIENALSGFSNEPDILN